MRIQVLLLIFSISLSASIGKLSAIRGDVYIEREGVKSKAYRGQKLAVSDSVITSSRAKAQIIFEDKTIVRIGRSTVFEIEDYYYDDTEKSKAKFRVKRGFFSAITGRIGKVSKSNLKFFTQTSTIGIRGTHFEGFIEESREDIACLKGGIYLTVGDRTIDILAGNILTIRDGIPEEVRELKSIDIEEMSSREIMAELESINTQVEALSNVKDSDLKYVQYSELMDELNSKYHDEVLKYYQREIVLGESSDSSVMMQLYTKYSPEGNSLEQIQNAVPYDIYLNSKESRELEIPIFWDGNSDGGRIAKYNGNIVFASKVEFNPEADGNSDFEKEVISQEDIFLENGVGKEINVEIDFQNGFVGGSFEYLENRYNFSNSGSGAVESDGFLFYSNNILSNSPNSFFFKNSSYNGEGVISSEFGIIIDEYTTIRGGFIAEQVDEVSLYKEKLGSDTIFDWGYWAYQFDGEEKQYRGGWIVPKEELTGSLPSEVSATYSGDIFGTVENRSVGKEAEKIDGTFQFVFNLMKSTMDGDVNFASSEEDFSFQFKTTNQIFAEDGSFQFNKNSDNVDDGTFKTKASSTDIPEYMYGSGNFYGENGEYVGGGFTAGFENGETAIAGFKGEKR